MVKADPLIRTKLHLPFTRPGLVPRPRLQAQILEGLRGPLTLITAPAGFGKTTLAASAVARCGMPAAWLSLDKFDNQAERFLSYLIAALQEVDDRTGREAAHLLAAVQLPPPETVLTSLVNDLEAAGRETALVLDDYQFISSREVNEAVAFLLDHCPNALHLVIVTRSDPALPLARLRARGQVVELRAADLRFSRPETAQFLNEVMGLHLDAGSVAILEDRTEGWIAGLQMAALSMRDRVDIHEFISGFSGTNRYILDYLLEEVLAGQPEEIQRFLLYTSILERLSAPLCDAVMANSAGSQREGTDRSRCLPQSTSTLEYLQQANLFLVPLDEDRCWYRYHHLFAGLLQSQLHRSEPEVEARLLSRAAEWCEQDGQAAVAVGYALAARDYEQAAGLIVKYWGPIANNGEIETVSSWLAALPEEVVRKSAPLSVAHCWVLWLQGKISAIQPHLLDAEAALSRLSEMEGAQANDEGYIGLPALVATLRSILERYNSNFAAARAYAEQALALTPENLPPLANAQIRSLIFLTLATAFEGLGDIERAVEAYRETIHWGRLIKSAAGVAGMTYRQTGALRLLGRLDSAEAACREALRFIEEQGMARLPATGILHLALAEILLERNELEAAEGHLGRGYELGRRSGRFDAVRNAAHVLSRLRQARQDVNGAMAAVQEAESAMGEQPAPLAKAELLALRARILVRQGSLSEAARCAEEAVRLAGRDRGQTGEMAAMAASRVLLARCEAGEAAAQLTQSLAAAEACGRWGVAIELHILRSLALLRGGNAEDAEADLERALTLAEPGGYVRVFLDEGQPMQVLLNHWLSHARSNPLRGYATRLLSQLETELPVEAAVQEKALPNGNLFEPLTPRELDVLSLLATGLSNRQIAKKLILSEGTVKFYVHVLLEKLGVRSRTQAALVARERNLV